MNKSPIEWTEFTSNPIRAHRNDDNVSVGHYCEKVSDGCKLCYASRLQKRFGMPTFDEAQSEDVTPYLDEKELQRLLKRRKPCKVFLGDMTDIFGDWVPDEWLDKIFAVAALTPHVTYQILTKRSKRMREYILGVSYSSNRRLEEAEYVIDRSRFDATYRMAHPLPWPLPNVHLGVSVENQQYADERIPDLLQTPAAVRFLSVEPMLGPVNLRNINHRDDALTKTCCRYEGENCEGPGCMGTRINWVIAGGESGPGARPMHPYWARSIRDQCVAAGVAFFFKQWGAWLPQGQFGTDGDTPTVANTGADWVLIDRAGEFNPETTAWNGKTGDDSETGEVYVYRVGKNNSGRLLDGREWNELPVREQVTR